MNKLYLKLLEMIDKNGDALNGEILAFIREHSLLTVMLLRQNKLAYLALGRLASDGYTIAQNDIAASLFAERNFDKSLWRKLTLSDDVWAEVVMVENSLLPVLEEKGVFGRITREKFREILENAYDLEAKDELTRLWRARFGNARLTPAEKILTPIDIFA